MYYKGKCLMLSDSMPIQSPEVHGPHQLVFVKGFGYST